MSTLTRAIVTEHAPAKINLTLRILGRRPDGYHELESLIAFASVGDTVAFDPGAPAGVGMAGPFAADMAGPNIAATALELLARTEPRLWLGHVRIEKRLPVASGIGGGSADAAAVLRAVRHANGVHAATLDWSAIARTLGADVPACLDGRAAVMTGTGERLEPVGHFPRLHAVLANPMAPVPEHKTARVFEHMAVAPYDASSHAAPARSWSFATADAVVARMREDGNGMCASARAIMPAIDDVLAALSAEQDCLLAALSGAGPTCFGIFPNEAASGAAAASLMGRHSGWWIAPAVLG